MDDEGDDGTFREIPPNDAQRVGSPVESRDLLTIARKNTMMAERDRIYGI